MRATRVLETVLYGRDIDAMRAFYEAVIGLEVDSELPGKFVFFKMADQMLLIFNPELSSIQKTEDGPPPHGPMGPGHMCLRSAEGDLARWQAHLEAHGVAIEKLMDWPDGEERIYEGRAHGTLAWPPRGALGHGYDPMFVPQGETRTFAELAPDEKNLISHRAKALEKLVRDLF